MCDLRRRDNLLLSTLSSLVGCALALSLLPACEGRVAQASPLGSPGSRSLELTLSDNWTFRLTEEGWWPNQLLYVYLADPSAPDDRVPIFSVQTDARGCVDVDVPYPTDARWRSRNVVNVILRDPNRDGQVVRRLRVGSGSPEPRAGAAQLVSMETGPQASSPIATLSPGTPTSTPRPALPPTPSPVAPEDAFTDWMGEYFDSVELQRAAPALIRNDEAVDFEWGSGSPDALLPADDFSARWTRRVDFEAGTYRFRVSADDGVRVFVDGFAVIEEWRAASGVSHVRDVKLTAGAHDLRVEMFERSGRAMIHFSYERLDTYDCWVAEYFANRRLAGAPRTTRSDAALHFDWGAGAPIDAGVPADGFSARWRRSFEFPGGVTTFFVRADDGVRLWIDDQLEIDEWHAASTQTYSQSVNLAEGVHTLTVEYYEDTARAGIEFYFEPPESGAWKGEYYSNRDLEGLPALARFYDALDFDWGGRVPESAECELPADGFSARWTRNLQIDRRGRYRFSLTVDDGLRVYVDGQLLRDEWHPNNSSTYSFLVDFLPGIHKLQIDYYEGGGQARVKMSEPEWAEDIP